VAPAGPLVASATVPRVGISAVVASATVPRAVTSVAAVVASATVPRGATSAAAAVASATVPRVVTSAAVVASAAAAVVASVPRAAAASATVPRAVSSGADEGGPTYAVNGTVKWFDQVRGFGFVTPDDGGQDVFLHSSVLQRAGRQDVQQGEKVALDVRDGQRGRQAVTIK
jgi:cold shock CspA family protein